MPSQATFTDATDEAALKNELTVKLKKELPFAVVFRHEDRYRAGIPDISVNAKKTLWLEVKHAKPRVRHRGIQDVTCMWLHKLSHCIYVIYGTIDDEKFVTFATPREAITDKWRTNERFPGHDHNAVVDHIRGYLS